MKNRRMEVENHFMEVDEQMSRTAVNFWCYKCDFTSVSIATIFTLNSRILLEILYFRGSRHSSEYSLNAKRIFPAPTANLTWKLLLSYVIKVRIHFYYMKNKLQIHSITQPLNHLYTVIFHIHPAYQFISQVLNR